MRFLEKDLESLIWDNYISCRERGLDIDQLFYCDALRFRQMHLGPFGIADLVYVYFHKPENTWYIQVIECKRGRVDGDTYIQAKRYVAAIEQLIGLLPDTPMSTRFHSSVVLVGDGVDCRGDIAHVIAQDKNCKTYSYKYTIDGVCFEDNGHYWWLETFCDEMPDLCPGVTNKLVKYALEGSCHTVR